MSEPKLGHLVVSQATGTAGSEADAHGAVGIQFMQLGQYGFISRAPKGSQVVLFAINGDEGNSVGIADSIIKGDLPTPEEGETVAGNYLAGTYIHFKNNGDIHVKGKIIHDGDHVQTGDMSRTGSSETSGLITGNGGMAVNGGSGVAITGDITQTGSLTVNGGTITNNGKNVGATHTHSGVTPGGGNTGVPN